MIEKENLRRFAEETLGAAMCGFAPVSRWGEQGDLEEQFHPRTIWPWARTVIVMLVPSLLPVVETKLSYIYRSQYHNTNSLLDEMAWRLAAWLNRQGAASINFCRDGYGIGPVPKKPNAAFSHVWAGHYAGLGKVGWNHALVTRKYGPRHRIVSVITALELPGDPMIEEELCTRCGLCEKACPGRTFSGTKQDRRSEMNRLNCTLSRKTLPWAHCGFCIKYCPIGEDRALYGGGSAKTYFNETRNLDDWRSGIGGQIQDWY